MVLLWCLVMAVTVYQNGHLLKWQHQPIWKTCEDITVEKGAEWHRKRLMQETQFKIDPEPFLPRFTNLCFRCSEGTQDWLARLLQMGRSPSKASWESSRQTHRYIVVGTVCVSASRNHLQRSTLRIWCMCQGSQFWCKFVCLAICQLCFASNKMSKVSTEQNGPFLYCVQNVQIQKLGCIFKVSKSLWRKYVDYFHHMGRAFRRSGDLLVWWNLSCCFWAAENEIDISQVPFSKRCHQAHVVFPSLFPHPLSLDPCPLSLSPVHSPLSPVSCSSPCWGRAHGAEDMELKFSWMETGPPIRPWPRPPNIHIRARADFRVHLADVVVSTTPRIDCWRSLERGPRAEWAFRFMSNFVWGSQESRMSRSDGIPPVEMARIVLLSVRKGVFTLITASAFFDVKFNFSSRRQRIVWTVLFYACQLGVMLNFDIDIIILLSTSKFWYWRYECENSFCHPPGTEHPLPCVDTLARVQSLCSTRRLLGVSPHCASELWTSFQQRQQT